MKTYYYLVESKNGNRYVMYGNVKDKITGNGISYLFSFASDDYKYGINTPYGRCSNVSTGIKYNSKQYRIVHQTEM